MHVPPVARLTTRRMPPMALARSRMLTRPTPSPAPDSCRPVPSSSMVSLNSLPSFLRATSTWCALAWRTTLVNDSWTIRKKAVVSSLVRTNAWPDRSSSMFRSLCFENSRANHETASPKPRSSRITGRSSEEMRRTEDIAVSNKPRMSSILSVSGILPSLTRFPSHASLNLRPVSCWPRSSCNSREIRACSCSRMFCWDAYRLRNCWLRAVSSTLARRCSVTSRSTAVSCILPRISVLEMEDSIGNKAPSRRRPNISKLPAIARGPSNDVPNRCILRS